MNQRTDAGSASATGGWDLRELECVESTNDHAAGLPAWSAVRADRQTAGRGRHRRAWVSDAGGLWLSAVVPTGPVEQGWAALPLVAGCAVCEVLEELGAGPLHLRWPNDVMSGRRKLAGLLVDCFRPGVAVIGLGINLENRPENVDGSLSGEVARLADFAAVRAVPAPGRLAVVILGKLREAVDAMARVGFAGLLPRVNRWWRRGTRVEIETDAGRAEGEFLGVDGEGRLLVRSADGRTNEFQAHAIVRLREKNDQA